MVVYQIQPSNVVEPQQHSPLLNNTSVTTYAYQMIISPRCLFKHVKNDGRVAVLFQCLLHHTQQKLYFSLVSLLRSNVSKSVYINLRHTVYFATYNSAYTVSTEIYSCDSTLVTVWDENIVKIAYFEPEWCSARPRWILGCFNSCVGARDWIFGWWIPSFYKNWGVVIKTKEIGRTWTNSIITYQYYL